VNCPSPRTRIRPEDSIFAIVNNSFLKESELFNVANINDPPSNGKLHFNEKIPATKKKGKPTEDKAPQADKIDTDTIGISNSDKSDSDSPKQTKKKTNQPSEESSNSSTQKETDDNNNKTSAKQSKPRQKTSGDEESSSESVRKDNRTPDDQV